MAYINQNGELINSDMVTCFDGAACHIDDAVYVESINHFAQYEQVIAGENGYELLPELMATLRNDANFISCEKAVESLNEKLVQFRDSNLHDLFSETHKERDEAMKKLAQVVEIVIQKGHKTEKLAIIDFTQDQEKTVNLSFKSECLKDQITLSKLFDEYDFDSSDDEDN